MRKENKKNKGFSLVELIIVIAIMAILGAVIAPQYFKHVKSSKVSSDIEQAARIAGSISAEIASIESGATVTNPLLSVPATSTAAAWREVSGIAALTGKVSTSKVEKDSKFYYRIDELGLVQVGVGTTTTIADDHILAPTTTEAKAGLWK